MKKVNIILSMFLILGFISCKSNYQAIYVSNDGNDNNKGSFSAPLLSLPAALAKSQEIGNSEIILKSGTYYLDKSIRLDPAFSGTEEHPFIIKSHQDEKVIISAREKARIELAIFSKGNNAGSNPQKP